MTTNHAGGMFGFFFSDEEKITRFEQVTACNQTMFNQFFQLMLEKGVYLAPSSYEAGFISAAHTMQDVDKTLEHAQAAFKQLSK